MKFICLGYIEEGKWDSLSAAEAGRMMEECFQYDDELRKGGHFLGGEALDSTQNAVTLRMKNGQAEVTDGPYAETKEVLGGILLLEAENLEQAVALMAKHPGVKVGPFEIRPADEQINKLIAARDLQTTADSTATSPEAMPSVVSRGEWQAARDELLQKEKELTQAKDAAAAQRRRLPMVQIEKEYVFRGPSGDVKLVDLFEGRSQLALYHFMFAEGVGGWPNAGCQGCSMLLDHIGHPAHINARDLTFAMVSRGPLPSLQAYKARMGWNVPWYSSEGTSFNEDFGATTPQGETHGLSVFLRDGENIYQTYFTSERGCEQLLSNFTLLDLAPFGRQETWEDSPSGWPQSEPYTWWRRHDEYAAREV